MADDQTRQSSTTTVAANPDRTLKVTDSQLSDAALAAREAALHRHEHPLPEDDDDDELRNHLMTGAALLNNIFTFAKDTILPDFAEKARDDNATVTHITEIKKLDNVEIDSGVANRPLPDVNEYYDIQKRFAEGGQGVLCKARDKLLNRVVAMKSLRPELRENEAITQAFVSEALITAQLEHPAIVSIYGLLQDREHGIYLAMKLVKGRDMRSFITEQITSYTRNSSSQHAYDVRLPGRIEMFLKVCDALAYAHARGVIHCDLKPENIMLGEYGEVYVMDWGIARRLRDAEGKPVADTGKGHLDGTPRFIPPEAYLTGRRDERSDIYALGLILFELLTLQRAYEGGEVNEVIRQVKENERRPVEHKFALKIPSALRAIVDKATAYNPDDRYQSVAEFSRDLQRYLADDAVVAMPETWLMRSMRWFRRHLRSAILCGLTGWLIAAVIGGHAARDTILSLQTQAQHTTALLGATDASAGELANAIAAIDAHALRNAMQLSRLAASWETALGALADRAAEAQSGRRLEDGSGTAMPIYPRDDADEPWKASANGGIYSERYRTIINPRCITASRRGDDGAIDPQLLRKMAVLGGQMQKLLLSSQNANAASPVRPDDAERLLDDMAHLAIPIRRVHVILTRDNLRMIYPGGSDSRPGGWDDNAMRIMESRRIVSPTWGAPYYDGKCGEWMVTCATPVTAPDGTSLGIAAFDLSCDALNELLFSDYDRNTAYLKARYIFSGDGQVLSCIRRGPSGQFATVATGDADAEASTAQPPPDELRQIAAGKRHLVGGHQLGREDSRSVIYHYAAVPSLDFYLVDQTMPDKY